MVLAVSEFVDLADGDDETIRVGEYEARDPDGDGLYDDVDAFSGHREADGVQNDPDAFDYDGNDRVGFADVLDLRRRICRWTIATPRQRAAVSEPRE